MESDSDFETGIKAALEVLLNNLHGPVESLPRTAAWGYPEPYTRDLLISGFGVLASGNAELIASLRTVLMVLAGNQSSHGQLPSLVHDPGDLGASDTTPLFLAMLAIYREVSGEADFLEAAAEKALVWMEYQSPDETMLVAQQPTTDWRDEQWVLGYGLYVNALTYLYLRLYRKENEAKNFRELFNHYDVRSKKLHQRIHEGLAVPGKPYYALWSFKMYNNERFDLLGNSLAVLSGLASRERARNIIAWVEEACLQMQAAGDLGVDLPPCLFPYILEGDADWYPRLYRFNLPGAYHNGGIWPFISGFYIAALVSAGEMDLARRKLAALTGLVRGARRPDLSFGFNEWYQAQDGAPQGQDWQTWSAAMYLFAATAVTRGSVPFIDGQEGDGLS